MRLQFLLKKQVFLKVQNPCRPGRIRRKALSGSLLGRIRATPRGWGALHTSVEKFHTRASTGRPGGVLLPLPPGLSPAAGRSPSTPASGPFSGSREESFHPCVRASFGRLNRTTERSLLPDGREGGRAKFFAPASEVFLRRPGGVLPPLRPGLFRAPQQDNRTEPFTDGREEPFHPCFRASFGRLNRATVRSLLPDGREGGRRLSGTPFRCRAEGAAQSRRDDEAAKVGNNPQKI